MILGKILAEDTHETPGKTLVGDAHDAAARPLPGPRQDPCRRHPRGRSQAHACQDSAALPTQLPAHQLGRHLRGDVWPLGQLSKHLRGGMQIFMKTLPPQQLSSQPASQHGTTCLVSSDARRSQARRRRLGRASLPSPIKKEGHVGTH